MTGLAKYDTDLSMEKFKIPLYYNFSNVGLHGKLEVCFLSCYATDFLVLIHQSRLLHVFETRSGMSMRLKNKTNITPAFIERLRQTFESTAIISGWKSVFIFKAFGIMTPS